MNYTREELATLSRVTINGHLVSKLLSDLQAAHELIERIKALVSTQAVDEGLWFVAQTAPEAYLQQELRRLHALIEKEIEDAAL